MTTAPKSAFAAGDDYKRGVETVLEKAPTKLDETITGIIDQLDKKLETFNTATDLAEESDTSKEAVLTMIHSMFNTTVDEIETAVAESVDRLRERLQLAPAKGDTLRIVEDDTDNSYGYTAEA